MPLTPEDVSNKRFTPVRLREGYDMGEVDQFLDEVESELSRLTKENDDLRSKLSAAQSGDPVSIDKSPEPAKEEKAAETPRRPLRRPLRRPPSWLRPPVARRSRCRPCPRRPRLRPGCSRSRRATPTSSSTKPRPRPTRLVSEARTTAERLESEAKAKADRAEADARQRSQMLDQETSERRTQLFGDLEKERDNLNSEVETLRSFEREYRSRLKSYFNQQLQALDNSGESEAPSDDGAGSAPKRLRSILGEDES